MDFARYSIIFCILYVIIKIIYCKKKLIKIEYKKEIINIIFYSYLAGLLSQTILPIINIGIVDGKVFIDIATYGNGRINIIPFRTIMEYVKGINDTRGIETVSISKINVIANIGLFIPFGLLFPVCVRKIDNKYTILIGTLLSLFIEVIQIFIKRGTDIDDVILNTIGVLVGWLIFIFVLRPRYKAKNFWLCDWLIIYDVNVECFRIKIK